MPPEDVVKNLLACIGLLALSAALHAQQGRAAHAAHAAHATSQPASVARPPLHDADPARTASVGESPGSSIKAFAARLKNAIASKITSDPAAVPLALQRLQAKPAGVMQVCSAAIAAGGTIPLKYSGYVDGGSPPLAWNAVSGARSYALILEDPDARPVTPYIHWVVWNIPATTTSLPAGLEAGSRPGGPMQGSNGRGTPGYFGPRPPAGDPPHHYHFQLLALDTMLDLPADAGRDQLLAAAKGHVLAKGELVGTFQRKVEPMHQETVRANGARRQHAPVLAPASEPTALRTGKPTDKPPR